MLRKAEVSKAGQRARLRQVVPWWVCWAASSTEQHVLSWPQGSVVCACLGRSLCYLQVVQEVWSQAPHCTLPCSPGTVPSLTQRSEPEPKFFLRGKPDRWQGTAACVLPCVPARPWRPTRHQPGQNPAAVGPGEPQPRVPVPAWPRRGAVRLSESCPKHAECFCATVRTPGSCSSTAFVCPCTICLSLPSSPSVPVSLS